MSKGSGSYESVVLGVSEQIPQDRRSGQHKEQVNMVSDPVRGLARRHGSVMRDENILTAYASSQYAGLVADTARHKELTFFVSGVEYALVYRTEAQPNAELRELGFAWCINKDTKTLVPIVYPAVDALMTQLKSGGVSAAVNIGKYVYLAGNTIVPTYTGTDRHGASSNKSKLAAWVRGGAYSRTFKVTLTRADTTTVVGEYKTKPSAYPELLDTSDLLTSDPDYQKKVNDRVNAYNSAVTAYIGEAAEDITATNIATKIAEDLISKGVSATVIESTVVINDATYVEISGEDSGDGTLLRAVGNEITALDLVSTVHWVGKVVKIRPKKRGGEDAFYLEAIPKVAGDTGWAEVTWRETAGYSMQPNNVFIQGTVVGGTLYLASSASLLASIAGGTHPPYQANTVGDQLTSPLPTFFDRKITYLGVHQDRLVIGSGATLLHSRPGDYFNWFRRSVLTVEETDAFEMYALGSEDDTIRGSTTYDRNVIYFGERFQYTVSGRTKLVPQTASMPIVSSHKDAVKAMPQTSGNFVFYGQCNNNAAYMHQIQTGVIAESPESYEISQQLESYLRGCPVQIAAMTSPNTVLLRTDAYRYGLYTYTYLDNANGAERIFDAWSRWLWDESLGELVGITIKSDSILALVLRNGIDPSGDHQAYIAVEEFGLATALSDRPYLDSLRPVADNTGFINPLMETTAYAAFGNASEYRFLGADYVLLDQVLEDYPDDADLWAGIGYPTSVTITNPYIRDQAGKAIVAGRLTLMRLIISVAQTGALLCDVATKQGTKRTLSFVGRILGEAANAVSRQPIVTTSLSASVGREVRECEITLSARLWLPLTITAIEWVGQTFNNSRRV